MSGDPDTDLTGWSLDELNQLALAVYHGVDGVEVVPEGVADDVAEHGVNRQGDKL